MRVHLPAAERFHSHIDWLDSWHSFSFGEHYDPRRMGFRSLRVINDDRIAGGGGFGTHGHRDMEILTWVLEGAVHHRDSTGGEGNIRPGELQRMSAGRGIRHSEFNASSSAPLRLLQIWLEPTVTGLEPGYAQTEFPATGRQGRLQLLASPDGRDGSLTISAAAEVYAAHLRPGDQVVQAIRPGRHVWVQVASGSLTINWQAAGEGDAVSLSDERELTMSTPATADVVVFDLA